MSHREPGFEGEGILALLKAHGMSLGDDEGYWEGTTVEDYEDEGAYTTTTEPEVAALAVAVARRKCALALPWAYQHGQGSTVLGMVDGRPAALAVAMGEYTDRYDDRDEGYLLHLTVEGAGRATLALCEATVEGALVTAEVVARDLGFTPDA